MKPTSQHLPRDCGVGDQDLPGGEGGGRVGTIHSLDLLGLVHTAPPGTGVPSLVTFRAVGKSWK